MQMLLDIVRQSLSTLWADKLRVYRRRQRRRHSSQNQRCDFVVVNGNSELRQNHQRHAVSI